MRWVYAGRIGRDARAAHVVEKRGHVWQSVGGCVEDVGHPLEVLRFQEAGSRNRQHRHLDVVEVLELVHLTPSYLQRLTRRELLNDAVDGEGGEMSLAVIAKPTIRNRTFLFDGCTPPSSSEKSVKLSR
jgi:hypothetical protein